MRKKKSKKRIYRIFALLTCLIFCAAAGLMYEPESSFAATAYSDWSSKWLPKGATAKRQYRAKLDYTKTAETATSVTYSASVSVNLNYRVAASYSGKLNIAGSEYSGSCKSIFDGGVKTVSCIGTKSKTFTKTASSQTKTIKGSISSKSGSWSGEVMTASVNVTIPALAPVTLSYNANGGSGAPASKTVNKTTASSSQAFTISSVIPKCPGHIFRGWALTADATSAQYQSGGSISIKNNTVLYAVWEEGYALQGSIVYDDDNNRDGIRPSGIKVEARNADGSCAGEVQAGASSYIIEGLLSDECVPFVEAPSGYTAEYDGCDIILKHEPEKVSIAGSVSFNDSSNYYEKRPDFVTIRLYKGDDKSLSNMVDETAVDAESDSSVFSFKAFKFENGEELSYIAAPKKGEAKDYAIGRKGNSIIYSIKNAMVNMDHAFSGCENLPSSLAVTYNVENVKSAYEGCKSLIGDITVDAEPDVYESFLKGTEKELRLIGLVPENMCSELVKTAGNGNAFCGHKEHSGIIASDEQNEQGSLISDGKYYDASENRVYVKGDELPDAQAGDLYYSGGYIYCYKKVYTGSFTDSVTDENWKEPAFWGGSCEDWSVRLCDAESSAAKQMLDMIGTEPVSSLENAFRGCALEYAPELSSEAATMKNAFSGCEKLRQAGPVPKNVRVFDYAFYGCKELEGSIIFKTDTLSSYAEAFRGTLNQIELSGNLNAGQFEALSKTSELGNVLY